MPLSVLGGTPIPYGPAFMAAPPPGAGQRLLGVPYLRQEQSNWCWDACCVMFLTYRGGPAPPRQCDVATRQFGAACCNTPTSSACDQGCWPENAFPNWAINFNRLGATIPFADIVTEIDAGRPVEVYYAWNGVGAHVALVIGYYANQDLEVNDPWYGPGRRAYGYVLSGYGQGAWRITYRDLT